ncbi:DUF397 domain-containing protein [Halosaccharopolyspora lacisalsi]|uniref:DUF397 domain-containing protein n=1 Tax=Halosaccharopolyspora lacisalsi TaxID=1000566 RepID=UPI001F34ADD0|nr:DUF397 domain-containing protein [Halosaccharopolyspora lacisalsi]
MPVPADFVQATWRRSSRSGNTGNCVEVAELPAGVRVVRDTRTATVVSSRWRAPRGRPSPA